jgi:Zn-dependent metalloprotease
MTIREHQFAALTNEVAPAPISGRFRPGIKSAVNLLSAVSGKIEVSPDAHGFVRHLTAQNSLFGGTYLGDAKAHAVAFISSANVQSTLALAKLDLDIEGGVASANPFGHQVSFHQYVKLPDGTKLPVRGATVQVSMDENGKIFNVASTLKHGRVMSMRNACSQNDAVKAARAKFNRLVGKLSKTAGPTYAAELKVAIKSATSRTDLVASEDAGKFDPCFEVTMSTAKPRQIIQFLVKASTGKVVHWESKIHYSVSSKAQQQALGRIAAKTFLNIPDPTKPLDQQIVDFYIDQLPDPKVLANDRYIMKMEVNGQWVPVTAGADGTFNFSPKGKDKDKFSAVVAFIALNLQSDINEGWGLKKQTRAIPVFVNDKSVTDNAYFDPENYEIHIGVGSGVANGGLTEMIGFDLGVLWHENRHHQVFLQTVAHDLPGSEGGACNEATADVHGQIVMEYMFDLMFGKLTKRTLTIKTILADPRIIGAYAVPGQGIRSQRNTKTVADKQGEVHADGEIVGGAMADALQGYCQHPDVAAGKLTLQAAIENYGRAGQLLLTLTPSRNVRFTDWRRCHITADQQLTGGTNRAAIEAAFDAHGIKATSATTGQTKKKGGSSTSGKGGKGKRKAPSNRRHAA